MFLGHNLPLATLGLMILDTIFIYELWLLPWGSRFDGSSYITCLSEIDPTSWWIYRDCGSCLPLSSPQKLNQQILVWSFLNCPQQRWKNSHQRLKSLFKRSITTYGTEIILTSIYCELLATSGTHAIGWYSKNGWFTDGSILEATQFTELRAVSDLVIVVAQALSVMQVIYKIIVSHIINTINKEIHLIKRRNVGGRQY